MRKYNTYHLCVYEDLYDKVYINKEGSVYHIDKLRKMENGEVLITERIRIGVHFNAALARFFQEIRGSYNVLKEKSWRV